MAYEKKPLEPWQKFPLHDGGILPKLRIMLDIEEGEDLPERVWRVLALHKCTESLFNCDPMNARDLTDVIIQAENLPDRDSNIQYIPGERVFVTKVQREGIYWFVAPMNRHMVNCQGDVFLVKASDIDAPDAALRKSELNRLAKLGAKVDVAIPPAPKPKEPAVAG